MKDTFNYLPSAVFCVILLSHLVVVVSQPLHTNSRWIVNEDGKRVKLACVNWVSHTQTVLAEGLSKRPLYLITEKIIAAGFNCVRFTWPVTLATNNVLASTTVKRRFQSLGLRDAIAGIRVYNPQFLNLTLIRAFQTVVMNLDRHNVMVILDNHLSKPGWCCSQGEDGFFGDRFFSPKLWIRALTKMTTMFKHTKNVVGVSLRNELRGPKQNVTMWHRYMERGAQAVHRANRHVLIIVSGLKFDNDLSFLEKRPMTPTYSSKVVFEVHRFGVSLGQAWADGNPNDVCGDFISTFKTNAAFLLHEGFPLFLSEFGGVQSGNNVNNNRFLNCMFGVIADLDLDWALWALQGSYYLRGAVTDLEEIWGVYDKNWRGRRNNTFMRRVHSVQQPFQGPGLFQGVAPYKLIYHPSTGLCMQKNSKLGNQIRLRKCEFSNGWAYNDKQRTITVTGTNLCVQAVGLDKPIKLGKDCTGSLSKWDKISKSRMHLSTKLTSGKIVCMDIDNSHINSLIVTRQCWCLNEDPTCDPARQWFKIITSQRKII